MRESWEQWLEQWEEYGFEIERIVDCGDAVLVVSREHGRGTASGATVSARNFMVLTFRKGESCVTRSSTKRRMPEKPPLVDDVAGERGDRAERLGSVGRGDWDPLYAFYHPDVIWDAGALRGPITGVYHGHEGVRRYFRDWLESFETHDARAETFIDAGDDVIVCLRLRGRGKASGVEVEMARVNLYRIRDGFAIRVELFETKAEALEAVGMSEQDVHADS